MAVMMKSAEAMSDLRRHLAKCGIETTSETAKQRLLGFETKYDEEENTMKFTAREKEANYMEEFLEPDVPMARTPMETGLELPILLAPALRKRSGLIASTCAGET